MVPCTDPVIAKSHEAEVGTKRTRDRDFIDDDLQETGGHAMRGLIRSKGTRPGSMSAEVRSEADRQRNLLGGTVGLLPSMCTLPRQVERCTVLGPKPQGETVLPLSTS